MPTTVCCTRYAFVTRNCDLLSVQYYEVQYWCLIALIMAIIVLIRSIKVVTRTLYITIVIKCSRTALITSLTAIYPFYSHHDCPYQYKLRDYVRHNPHR